MVTALIINFNFDFELKFEFADFINIVGIGVNAFLAYKIVTTIQNKLNNDRVLKDHFISEIKEIKEEYNLFYKDAYNGNLKPKDLLRWFKLMSVRIHDLMKILNAKYSISMDSLKAHQVELRELVDTFPEFNNNHRHNTPMVLERSKVKIEMFQQNENDHFNKIIILINDHISEPTGINKFWKFLFK